MFLVATILENPVLGIIIMISPLYILLPKTKTFLITNHTAAFVKDIPGLLAFNLQLLEKIIYVDKMPLNFFKFQNALIWHCLGNNTFLEPAWAGKFRMTA